MITTSQMHFITNNGVVVFVDAKGKERLTAHPDVIELLPKVISRVTIPQEVQFYETEIDFGKTIGMCGLVKTEPVDFDQKTLFAYRNARKYPSRVVTDSKGKPCSSVTLSVRFDIKLNRWMLVTAYIGYLSPDEPYYFGEQESQQFKDALIFWSNHALVYDKSIAKPPFESSWEEELAKIV